MAMSGRVNGRMLVQEAKAHMAALMGTEWQKVVGKKTLEEQVLGKIELHQSQYDFLERPEDDGLATVQALKVAEYAEKVERLVEKGSDSNPLAVSRLADEEKMLDFWRRKLAIRRKMLRDLEDEIGDE